MGPFNNCFSALTDACYFLNSLSIKLARMSGSKIFVPLFSTHVEVENSGLSLMALG